MRQNVFARRFASSIAAIVIARISWGIVEMKKMLKVLRMPFQKFGCWRT